jgi:phospholipid/cholesterol/gamma-HCH transport system substrate-binding protein
MEIRARYVLIGLFVLAVIAGGFGFVYWLNNNGGVGERAVYRIAFDGSVSGLMAGSDVLFNGMDVGEVTNLSLVPDKPGRVMATVAVDRGTPIRADTHVGLVFGGLTGTAAVALSGGAAGAVVPAGSNGEPPLLVADPSSMKDMTQAARDALAHFDALLTDNSAALTEAIANIGAFSAALGRNSDKVDGILQGLEKLTGGGKTETQVNYDLTAPSTFSPVGALPSAQLALPAPTTVITIDTQRIMMQTADGEAPTFPDVRWADNIPVLFQARIIQGFENAQYLRVGTDAGDLTADYKLAIDIRRFHVTTSPGPATAEVEFSAKVLDVDGKVAGARIFSASSPVTATDNAAIAAKALDTVFGQAATDLIVWTLTTINVSSAAAGEPTTTP